MKNTLPAVSYARYTRRYPLEDYDHGVPLYVVRTRVRKGYVPNEDSDAVFGPIAVYPRKRRFSRKEAETIWIRSEKRCHICRRRWSFSARGSKGWHIDHVIPHVGGGSDTEELGNFRVACAQCNLSKGRGYKEPDIQSSVDVLLRRLLRS